MVLAYLLKPLNVVLTFCKWSAIVLTAIMLAVMVVQVFFRYVLNDSIVWAEELSTFMMMWVAFLVAPVLYRDRMNVAITMLLEKLPARIQQILLMILEIAIIAVIVYFFFESLNVVKRGAMTKVSSVPINFFHVNLVVPFSMVVMFWVGLINLWEAFQNILAKRKLEIGVTSSQGLK